MATCVMIGDKVLRDRYDNGRQKEDGISPSAVFVMARYRDEDLMELMRTRPKMIYIQYISKRDIVMGIKNGKYKLMMLNEAFFTVGTDKDGYEYLVLFASSSGNTRILRDENSADFARFNKLLLATLR